MTTLSAKKTHNGHSKNGNVTDGLDILQCLGQIISARKEYKIVKEQESTKRLKIEADLVKHVTLIKEQRGLLESYLNHEYGLRSEMTREFLKRLDRALDEDKDSVAIQALDSLEKMITKSPLGGLAQIRQTFENENAVLEI